MIDLKLITEAVNADSAAIMVPDSKNGYSYCQESYNMPGEWVAIKNSFLEEVPGGNVEVYKIGKPAITNHLRSMLEGHYIESVIIVPVLYQNETIAMLELVHSTDDKVFTNNDLAVAEKFTQSLVGQLQGNS